MSEAGDGWRLYYDKTTGRPPRPTLLAALAAFEREGRDAAGLFAVDLGCGSGRDTIELLRRSWAVLAIDSEPAAIEELSRRADLPAGARLQTQIARLETAEWPACDLVNASFSLPLVPREAFAGLWRRIRASLRPDGRFAGQLYGERDGWAGNPEMTHLSRPEIDAFLDGLAVEMFEEIEEDSLTPRGKPKHWHVFHLVARKT